MRVLYFGTYSTREGYPRNRVLIEGLRRAGVEVAECHEEFWSDAAHKISEAVRGWRRLRAVLAYARTWTRLARRYLASRPPDVIVVGYTGQVDVLLARLLGLLSGRPVVLDAFLSLFDTIVGDRELVPRQSALARLLRWLDITSCRAADLVLLDTKAHIRRFRRLTRLPDRRFARLFVGEDDRVFHPIADRETREDAPLRVLWFGTYVPLQGVDIVLSAARELAGRPVEFRLVGRGQLFDRFEAEAEDLPNVTLVPRWISYERLTEEIHDADVCLGIFGATDKALRVIPCKVYDALACGRPVITSDTPAARELLVHRENAYLVTPGAAGALAAAVIDLLEDEPLRLRLGREGRRCFENRATPDVLGREFAGLLLGVTRRASPSP